MYTYLVLLRVTQKKVMYVTVWGKKKTNWKLQKSSFFRKSFVKSKHLGSNYTVYYFHEFFFKIMFCCIIPFVNNLCIVYLSRGPLIFFLQRTFK